MDAPHAPRLHPDEAREARKRTTISAGVVHEAIRREGELELHRTNAALAFSGIAGGLSMGLSLLTEGLLTAHLPDVSWRVLVATLGYPVGFLAAILARQQLFTENTVTPVIPLLARRDRATLRSVARFWAVVLAANLVGTAAVGVALAAVPVLEPPVQAALLDVSRHAIDSGPTRTFLEALGSGWLIALMAWILGGQREPNLTVIFVLTYIVGLAGLSHVVAGAVDVAYLAARGLVSPIQEAATFLLPALAGNAIGGVALVTALNHSQVVAGVPSAEEPSPPSQ